MRRHEDFDFIVQIYKSFPNFNVRGNIWTAGQGLGVLKTCLYRPRSSLNTFRPTEQGPFEDFDADVVRICIKEDEIV